jgi:hypothetical protein
MPYKCPTCNGKRFILLYPWAAGSNCLELKTEVFCSDCHGTGIKWMPKFQ